MKSIDYPEEMRRLYAENARMKERALLLEHTLRNAAAVLASDGHVYANAIYLQFPEFKPAQDRTQ